MTPQERKLVDELFDRLSRVEGGQQDPDAVDAIASGLRRAPNALYALVQTTLLQDEALRQAQERIDELERATTSAQPQGGGFLDTMRGAMFGQGGRGSVPSSGGGRPAWNTGEVLGQPQQSPAYGGQPFGRNDQGFGQQQRPQQQPPAGGRGGSFLGTAAATVAGVVGGSLLMNSLSGMMGGSADKQGLGNTASAEGSKSPWSNDQSGSGGDLAKDAGLNDVGSSGQNGGNGFFDSASYDDADGYDDYDDSDFG